jgi:plasmid replication initiation protein
MENKDVIQSYLLTSAKYDYDVYEKRILYRLVELLQAELGGQKPNVLFIQKNILGDNIVTLPIKSFLLGDEDKNHGRIKKALLSLRGKTFEIEDDKKWKAVGIIEKPSISKEGKTVTFEIQQEIYDAILNFAKGYRKYELKTAMSFNSIYTMRFYELFSGQTKPITYSIDHLKIMFKLVDKYPRTNDFIKRVILSAQKELKEKSPYSFEFEPNKGTKIISLTFYPIKVPENVDVELEKKRLSKKVSLHWEFPTHVLNYLIENFHFTETELKNNIDLFKKALEKKDLLYEISILKPKALSAKNPKGYVINALKKMMDPDSNKRTPPIKRGKIKANPIENKENPLNEIANLVNLKTV